MKAITLHEPWASLIVAGKKTIETRNWSPPDDLIGETIAIHAGKNLETMEFIAAMHEGRTGFPDGMWKVLHDTTYETMNTFHRQGREVIVIPAGRLLGFATLAGVIINLPPNPQHSVTAHGKPLMYITAEELQDNEAFGLYGHGRYGWVLRDIQKLPDPPQVRGRQRFWEVPHEIVGSVELKYGACPPPADALQPLNPSPVQNHDNH